LFSLFAADPYELMPDTPFPDAPLPPLHNDVHLLHKDNAPAVKWMIGKAMYRCLFLLPLCTSFWLFVLASMLAFPFLACHF
jgi:hypothetical protein